MDLYLFSYLSYTICRPLLCCYSRVFLTSSLGCCLLLLWTLGSTILRHSLWSLPAFLVARFLFSLLTLSPIACRWRSLSAPLLPSTWGSSALTTTTVQISPAVQSCSTKQDWDTWSNRRACTSPGTVCPVWNNLPVQLQWYIVLGSLLRKPYFLCRGRILFLHSSRYL